MHAYAPAQDRPFTSREADMYDPRAVDATATPEERTWATFLHLGGLMAWFVIGPFCVLVPLVMWLIKKDESEYLDDHGREALNFELSLLVYLVLLIPIGIITLGLVYLLWAALAVVGPIFAAVAGNKGRYFRYPATIRFIAPRY